MSTFTPPLNLGKTKELPKGAQPPPPPPLKAMSVKETLKKPEFQLPLSKVTGKASVTKSENQVGGKVTCIDLTDSDDEKESEKKPSTSSAGQSMDPTKTSLGNSGLQLGKSGGLKLGTSGGLQLGSNAGMSTICGAATAGEASSGTLLRTNLESSTPSLKPLSQFAPPSGSWECGQCLVNNQAKDEKCVACGAPKPTKTNSKSSEPLSKPLPEFAPPSGSWECSQCLVRNQAKDKVCVACTAPKPSAKAATVPVFKPLLQFAPPSGSWECGQCLVNNQPKDEKCVACGAPKPTKSGPASTTSKPPGSLSSLGPLTTLKSNESAKPAFLGGTEPSVGSWSCEVCLVQNKAGDVKCVACTASKPASKTSSDAPPTVTPPTTTGANWTCSTCLVVNKAEDTTCVACSSSKMAAKPSSAASLPNTLPGLAPPQGNWTCDTCLVQNKATDTKCVACTTPKPGAKKTVDSGGDKNFTSSTVTMAGGLTTGASGGLKLGGDLSLAGLAGKSSHQEGFKPIGGAGKKTQGTDAGGGGVKINASLSSLVQSKTDTLSSEPMPISGAPIPQLPEKNPLAGIKFGVAPPPASTTTAAVSQNLLTGIKFGIPSTATIPLATTTVATAPLQFNFTSTSSSPFKLGMAVGGTSAASGNQSSGLKLGSEAASASVGLQLSGAQQAAPKLVIGGLGPTSTSQASTLGSGPGGGTQLTASTAAVNPLAGLKFGVPPSSGGALSTSTNALQFPSQLQFGTTPSTTSTTSLSVAPFNFLSASTTSSATTSNTSQGTGLGITPFTFSGAKSSSVSSNSGQPVLQFGASALNTMLNASGTSEKPSSSSSLFVFSGNKDISKIDSSSPFPSTGSASASLGGGFGASGGVGGTAGLGGSGIEPFQFGKGSGKGGGLSGTLFGKQDAASAGQPQGLSLVSEFTCMY